MAVAAATDSNERSHRGDEVCGIAQAEPKRFAALAREVMSKSERTAGHRSAASVAQIGQPLGAPLMRRYFRAHAATPYLCFRRIACATRKIRPGVSSPGGPEL